MTENDFFIFCEKLEEFGNRFEFADGNIYEKNAGKIVPKQIVDLVLHANSTNFLDFYELKFASFRHLDIVNNIQILLFKLLNLLLFRVYSEGCSVHISATGKYRIPDLVVVDAKNRELIQNRFLKNPFMVLEVLSPSTQEIDLGAKINEYKSIPNLKDYIIVWQDQAKIFQFSRTENGFWLETTYENINDIVQIDFLEIALPLREIYREIEF